MSSDGVEMRRSSLRVVWATAASWFLFAPILSAMNLVAAAGAIAG
jgi:hypothetical protein